jgi:ketosteroid isomerase-like protein
MVRTGMIETLNPSQSIAAASRRFQQLFAANDIAGIAACYTHDAQMLVASMQPIRGRAQIESVFKFTGGQGHTLEFQSQELDVQGTTAIEIGRYTRRQSDGATLEHGLYLVVWKRVGGEWKIHRDMFNTSAPKLR